MINKIKLISIHHSNNGRNKYTAIFDINGRRKTTHFGAAGMDDYTLRHDADQRSRYLKRHQKDLHTGDPTRAGFLSYYILWGPSTSIQKNISMYKKHFHL